MDLPGIIHRDGLPGLDGVTTKVVQLIDWNVKMFVPAAVLLAAVAAGSATGDSVSQAVDAIHSHPY